LKAQDLRAPEIQNKTDAELATLIANGKGKMPAFKSSLSDDVIKSVVAHLRTLKK
jgi:mono/diheme cytochrome c family protein